MAEIQKSIEKINAKRRDSMDTEWQLIKEGFASKKPKVIARDQNEAYLIIAQILTNIFSSFLATVDKARINSLIASYQSNPDPNTLEELAEICNKYNLLTEVYMFAIVGNNSDDPLVANKAKNLYRQMMESLDEHDVAKVKMLVNENSDFLNSNMKDAPMEIIPGTGIGSNN